MKEDEVEIKDGLQLMYHSTYAATAVSILRDGFRDAEVGDLVGPGLANYPRSYGDAVLRICIPTSFDLGLYEVTEDQRDAEPGMDGSPASREWLVPAEVLNGFRREICPEDERPDVQD